MFRFQNICEASNFTGRSEGNFIFTTHLGLLQFCYNLRCEAKDIWPAEKPLLTVH